MALMMANLSYSRGCHSMMHIPCFLYQLPGFDEVHGGNNNPSSSIPGRRMPKREDRRNRGVASRFVRVLSRRFMYVCCFRFGLCPALLIILARYGILSVRDMQCYTESEDSKRGLGQAVCST
jgi:hypothetical protein